jgi:myo-inositol-1(or 4)-monophosphatase
LGQGRAVTSIPDASRLATNLALSLLAQSTPDGARIFKTDRDFSTETDLLIERRVRELLAKLTPEVGFLGEEFGGDLTHDAPFWCLDPLDGTVNFARGIPAHGISLAYIEGDQPRHGEIALPALGERYTTTADSARLNGKPICVSHVADLRNSVVSLGDFATGPDSAAKNRIRLATLGALSNKVQRVRMLGSAAVDLAWLAAGRLDAVVMHSNNTWDMAAGIALATKAGAQITELSGAPYSTHSQNFVAANPRLHDLLKQGIHEKADTTSRPK